MSGLFDGSPELTALLRALYRAFGEGSFPEPELWAHVRTILVPPSRPPSGPRSTELGVASLMRGRVVQLVGDSAFRLTPRCAAFAKASIEEDERELALVAEDIDVLFGGLLSGPVEARERAEALERIDCVTPELLSETLAEAELPREFLDLILATYRTNGRVVMSEDGGAYRFVLVGA